MCGQRSWSWLVLTLLVLTTPARGADADDKPEADKPQPRHEAVTSLPAIPDEVHDALQSRHFEDAVELIDRHLKDQKGPADYLLYLKGRALTDLGRYDDALAAFQALPKKHPKSRWVPRARFGEADVYARQRNYLKSGDIYRAEAERLLSDGRKDELAGIYLEFADRYFEGVPQEGPTSKKEPDYNLALTYYREALTLNPSRPLRQKIELRIARCHQELKQFSEAIAAYQQFLKQYSGKDVPKDHQAPAAMLAEARYQLGMSQLHAGQPAEARKTWQDFLASDAADAAGNLVALATYHLADTYGMPAPATVGDLELGVAALEAFIKKFPDHELAPKAEYEIAQGYIHFGRYEQAIARLKQLIGNKAYAKSDVLPEAHKLLGQSYFAQHKYEQAIAAWKEFLEQFPTNSSWSDVQRLVIDAEYQRAEEQYQDENYDQARQLWATFLNKYPLDPRAAHILFRFGQMKYAQGVACQRDEEKGDKDRELSDECRKLFEGAIDDWRRLLSKYPNTNEASQAGYMIGVTLEDQLGRLADALEAYKKVTGTFQAQAQQRTANLTAKQLEVVTERKYRSNETPRIRIETRNIKQVTVKAYRIDMTDYFRKMHLARGVETLDIALIDPDKSWEYAVEGYDEYRRLTNSVEIPMDGPGAMAVTVSSETLEATTMVVVSDLDVIVKASRNELFVFAENLRTQKPAAGASLLISDGETVFAEELTGEQGIVQKSYDRLKNVNDLRVFAVQEGHMASANINLTGLEFAVGLSPRGYLYTDRPAYRPGQLVNVRGIIRWVTNDQFTFKAGEKYKLDVYDSRGRVLHTHDIALNEYGTFADHFTLPESVPQGDCRVHVHQPGKEQSYETSFGVHEIKLEPIQLLVETGQKVYYRGETVEGTITLRYYYGTPLSGRQIQYRLADDRWHTAETDAQGKVKFSFPTQRFSESQALPLVVQYPERNLATTQTVYLATRGFDIAVSTLRDVYISGETFDATVTVTDPAGKPVATDLKLEVFRLFPATGKRAARLLPPLTRGGQGGASGHRQPETLVETHELKSDKEGRARQTVRLDEAGQYVLRATGTDRFGHPVSGQSSVQISGDEDTIRLRILAAHHFHQVGDTAKVQLHWREKPALALVTYEGATILGHKLVELKEGANALDIPLDARLAPNFVLAVDVMQGHAFHQARSEFRVTRKLQIALKPSKTTLKPGEELTVAITATDPQGKPVSAELSLGLVQQNLLAVFSERQEAIHEFFGGGDRKPSVRSGASSTFQYHPTTRPISQTLLAEEERRRILEMEHRAMEELARMPAGAAEIPGVGLRVEGVDEASIPFSGGPGSGAFGTFGGRESHPTDGAAPAGEVDHFFAYNQLMQQGQFEAAQQLVQQAWDRDPANPALEALRWKAQNNAFYDFNANGAPMGGMGMGIGGMGFGNSGGAPAQNAPTATAPNAPPAADKPQDLRQRFFFGRRSSRSGRRSLDEQGQAADRKAGAKLADSEEQAELAARLDVYDALGRNKREDERLGLLAKSRLSPEDVAGLAEDFQSVKLTLLGVNGRGELQVVNGLPAETLRDLARDGGLMLLPGMASAETGYWNPVVATDKDGKAEVRFRLPERSMAWQLRAKGITGDTLAGQADTDIVSKQDLFAELKTPLAFTVGDTATLLVEVHNQTVKQDEPITVTFKATLGDKTTQHKKQLKSAGPGVQELSFPLEIGDADAVSLAVTVTSGELENTAEATVPVRPFGVPVFASAAGTAAQSTIAFVKHDKSLPVESRAMEIVIGPSINRTLVDAVLGSDLIVRNCGLFLPTNGIERAFSDVLGGVAVLKTMRDSKTADSPEAQAVSGRVQSALAQLVSSQRDDGGWSWSGQPGSDADPLSSSRVMWALAAARKAGFAVPQTTFDQGTAFLKTAFTKWSQTDREGQAILLHGLTAAGAGDFAYANRLYRERNNLSPSGLLHVALALSDLDRREMAQELVALVEIPVDPQTAPQQAADPVIRRVIPWMQSGVELRALYLLALEETKPGSATAPKLVEWLMGARRGSRWQPEKANGPAIAALARWSARTKQADEKYELAVYVNEKLLEKLTIDPARDASRRLTVPDKLLVDGQQKIHFDITGRGTYSYSVVLAGFVPADKVKGTVNDWNVRRTYEPAQRMLDGEVIPRGFGVLQGSYTTFRNPLTQLPMGERGEVTLHVWRSNIRGTADEQLDYLIITEPIPAGTMVLPDSVTGPFERYEIALGAITFYIGDRPSIGDLHYTLVGYLPGRYRAVPTVVRSFYQPERIAVSEVKSLEVLGRGEESKDDYKLTPQELYEFGKRLAAKGEYQQADDYLTQLFKNWRLQDNIYQEVVRLLFRTALETGQNDRIVTYFEIIKERYPDVEIDFASILKVAAAYRELGEYERSYLVYRATLEASFERESQIAGFLDERGEFVRSVQVLERILRDYPAESYIAIATYALAQEVYGKASEAADNEKLREAKITRIDLIATAIRMLNHFLSTWPRDPAADQAAFSLLSAHLDLEQYKQAIARAEDFARWYPDSDLLDSYWYIIGFSQFALGDTEDALKMAQKVAQSTHKDKQTGVEVASANKWQAIYIMGQIYHSLGKPKQAIAEYKQVDERFPDAAETIRFFTHKELKLPEITTIRPGDAAKVPLSFRNIESINLKVYRIDLMKFGLMQRNLDRITAINLAGIRPYHELTLDLGDGQDFRDRERPLDLPLKEEGAYLVVARGSNHYASGLVLVTPLDLEVQEDAVSGRVRVTVRNTAADRYVSDVPVKVIGSANETFVSGETDLRGIFTADGIRGTATVIARTDANRYAFYRGKTWLGQRAEPGLAGPAATPQPQSAAGQPAAAEKKEVGKPALLENVRQQNFLFQQQQRGNYRSLLDNSTKGVKAKSAF